MSRLSRLRRAAGQGFCRLHIGRLADSRQRCKETHIHTYLGTYILYAQLDRGPVSRELCSFWAGGCINLRAFRRKYCMYMHECVRQRRAQYGPVGGGHQAPALLRARPPPLLNPSSHLPPLHPPQHRGQDHIGQTHPDQASLQVLHAPAFLARKGRGSYTMTMPVQRGSLVVV